MSSDLEPDWEQLAARHPAELVERLRRELGAEGTVRITAEQLAAATHFGPAPAAKLLDELAADHLLEREVLTVCPHCGAQIDETAASDTCAECGVAWQDAGGVKTEILFTRKGERSRDVAWVLCLHGMNTRGAWQEELNWRVSRTYGRSVPVAIYKYGIVRPGVLLRFRQRQLIRCLLDRVRRLTGESSEAGFGASPDIIAHSFGTWLLGHALDQDPTLVVGRVILTGSILRPDFPWEKLIARRQVETVLNHYGTRDFWARIAHYLIPDAGPSGRRGFDSERVHNLKAEGFTHSRFFAEAVLPGVFETIWKPFLTLPEGRIAAKLRPSVPHRRWNQAWWPFRATLPRYALLLLASALVALVAAAFGCGLVDLARCLAR